MEMETESGQPGQVVRSVETWRRFEAVEREREKAPSFRARQQNIAHFMAILTRSQRPRIANPDTHQGGMRVEKSGMEYKRGLVATT